MTGKLVKQMAIQKSVMDVMEKNLAAWQSVEEMRKDYDLFVRNLKKIDDDLAEIKKDLAPLKKKRLRSKNALIQQLSPVTGILEVYAGDSGDRKLARLTDSRIDDLKRLKTDALKQYCEKVLKEVASLMETQAGNNQKGSRRMISGYGLTEEHLERLKKALDQYATDAENHMNSRNDIRKSRARLERRVRENSQLLKKRMDRMMLLFHDSHKDFHDAYFSSR
jgi:chromosome segregation ATPase